MTALLALLRRIPVLGWVAIALLVAIAVQTVRLHAAQEQKRKAGIELENAKARVDTLKVIEHLSAKDSAALGLGDSMQVLARLVVQGKQQRDALDRSLSQERVANLNLTATVATLRASIGSSGSVSTDSNDVRSARFDLRQAPFTFGATAKLPRIGQARLDSLSIALDTARLSVRLGCGQANVAGVRSAQMTLIASDWLKLGAPSIEQSEEVCRNDAKSAAASRAWWKPSITAGYGAIAVRDSSKAIRVKHGPGVFFGWTIWP